MARSGNLPAELEPRASDVKIPALLLPKIPPFSELKAMAKLFNFPGSVILRRFRKGEVVCRQGEAGWTAFYIPKTKELEEIRESPNRQLALAAAELTKIETQLEERQKQLQEASGDPKKSESLKGKLVESEEQLEEIKNRIEVLKEAGPYLKGEIVGLPSTDDFARIRTAGDEALKKLGERLDQAGRTTDASKGFTHSVLSAGAVKKRAVADALEANDPELAKWLRDSAAADETRQVASVQLVLKPPASDVSSGFFAHLAASILGRKKKQSPRRPSSIPIDGPRELDSETLQGVLNEGEIFGEMSCLYRSPRSATVVASRDCYIIEMLRNVLDAMTRDAGFRAGLDRAYRERVLGLQLRNIPILNTLDDRQIDLACRKAELVDLPSGGLLYDENDSSDDGMHLIRSGIVKVMQNVSFLVAETDVKDWPSLLAELAEGGDAVPGPRSEIRSRLPASLQEALAANAAGIPTSAQMAEVVAALNVTIKDPLLDHSPQVREVALAQRAGRNAWQRLAAPSMASEREMHRCQRLILEMLFGNKIPEWKSGADEESFSPLFRATEFRDWKAAAIALLDGGTKAGEPKWRVWELLAEPIRAILDEAKAGKAISSADQANVIDSLNTILRGRPLILYPEFQDYLKTKKPAKLLMEFLPNNEAWREADYHLFCRTYNRYTLDGIFPKGLGTSRRPEGPSRVLAYVSRGGVIGEMALVDNKRRIATCVAYSHPDDDPEREVGPTQLVRISKDLFDELRTASTAFDRQVVKLSEQRREENRNRAAPKASDAFPSPLQTGQAEVLGLYQGQKLMLIDLERCTRCDECVQACVNTHDDGQSRLFLDGPRYGKFLVPSTCRSCLDPVCMIGCPVGSIHRGSNNEIIIEDWCIGCEQCANQCPYGSIQMHTVGIIPGATHGWRYAPATRAPLDWFMNSRAGRNWPASSTPFVHDREFRESLAPLPSNGVSAGDQPASAICFRYEFNVEDKLRSPGQNLILALSSMDEQLRVWINGREIVTPAGQSTRASSGQAAAPVSPDAGAVSRRKSRDWGWWEIEAVVPATFLRGTGNLLAVEVTPCRGNSDRLLDLRLDLEQGETVKLVEQKAVVCDLCSEQYGQVPACVTACPHDAAIRVDALTQLPVS